MNVQYRSLTGFREVDRLNHRDEEVLYERSHFETTSENQSESENES